MKKLQYPPTGEKSEEYKIEEYVAGQIQFHGADQIIIVDHGGYYNVFVKKGETVLAPYFEGKSHRIFFLIQDAYRVGLSLRDLCPEESRPNQITIALGF